MRSLRFAYPWTTNRFAHSAVGCVRSVSASSNSKSNGVDEQRIQEAVKVALSTPLGKWHTQQMGLKDATWMEHELFTQLLTGAPAERFKPLCQIARCALDQEPEFLSRIPAGSCDVIHAWKELWFPHSDENISSSIIVDLTACTESTDGIIRQPLRAQLGRVDLPGYYHRDAVEVVRLRKHPYFSEKKIPGHERGIVFRGPAGCGKTTAMIAGAVHAFSADVVFYLDASKLKVTGKKGPQLLSEEITGQLLKQAQIAPGNGLGMGRNTTVVFAIDHRDYCCYGQHNFWGHEFSESLGVKQVNFVFATTDVKRRYEHDNSAVFALEERGFGLTEETLTSWVKRVGGASGQHLIKWLKGPQTRVVREVRDHLHSWSPGASTVQYLLRLAKNHHPETWDLNPSIVLAGLPRALNP